MWWWSLLNGSLSPSPGIAVGSEEGKGDTISGVTSRARKGFLLLSAVLSWLSFVFFSSYFFRNIFDYVGILEGKDISPVWSPLGSWRDGTTLVEDLDLVPKTCIGWLTA